MTASLSKRDGGRYADAGRWASNRMSLRGFSSLLWAIVVAIVALAPLHLQAQSGDVVQTVARWNGSNATCRNPGTPALEAIGACEQRDRFSNILAQMNQCYGPSGNA